MAVYSSRTLGIRFSFRGGQRAFEKQELSCAFDVQQMIRRAETARDNDNEQLPLI